MSHFHTAHKRQKTNQTTTTQRNVAVQDVEDAEKLMEEDFSKQAASSSSLTNAPAETNPKPKAKAKAKGKAKAAANQVLFNNMLKSVFG